MKSSKKVPIRNIFLRNRANYGAQITCLPFLFAIKTQSPTARIKIIYKEGLYSFYNQFDWIDHKVKSASFFSDFNHISQNQHCISLRPNSLAQRVLFLIKGAYPREALVKSKSKLASPLLTTQIKFDEEIYRAALYLKLLNQKGMSSKDISEKLKMPFIHESIHSNLNISRGDEELHILIMPGGGAGEFKKWGIKNFLYLCKNLEKSINKKIIIHVLIGPDEKKEKEELTFEKKSNQNINTHENLSISDISKLILSVEITISNDCGPSHIAQCLQNGFVGIFDKEKKEWFYKNETSQCITPPLNGKISDITIKDVTMSALSILNKKRDLA